ncbi:MAG: lipoprotein [Gammaproteobacteria bacterium]|jgi:predicted small lipoprotein YifL|nr:lipoprotein [Gammaproteobacteria bacterium]
MNSQIAIRLLLLCAVALSGCGQKGPLYLPDKQEPPAENKTSDSPDT